MDVKTCCTCSAMKPQWLPNPKQRTFLAQLFRPSIILTEQCPSSTSTQAHTPLILTLSPYQTELKPLLSMLLVHNIRYIALLALNILCVVYSSWSYPIAESVWAGVGSNECYSSQDIFWIIIFNLVHIFMVTPAWLFLITRPRFEIYLCRKSILVNVISRLQGTSEYPHNPPTECTPKRKYTNKVQSWHHWKFGNTSRANLTSASTDWFMQTFDVSTLFLCHVGFDKLASFTLLPCRHWKW